MKSTMYALHYDQRFVGTFENYEDARQEMLSHSPHFERAASIPSGGDSVDVYVCRPNGIVNYAYASITIIQ